MGEAEADEVRQLEPPAAQAFAIAAAIGAGLGDMAERVGAGIAIGRRIGRAAATDRVQHDQERARHAQSLTAAVLAVSRLSAAASSACV